VKVNANVDNSVRRRGRAQLILIAMLFAAPVVTAWVAWNFAVSGGVDATTNAGQLVNPVRPLQPVNLKGFSGEDLGDRLLTGRWSYVLLSTSGCNQQCAEKLYLTRQVRTGVNKDMQRVQRLLVLRETPADIAALRAAHPDLKLAIVDEGTWQAFAGQFGGEVAAEQGVFFMVDPLGNLMMRYDDKVEPKGVLKDLRKLLKVSQVG
jgi:cytochrome oxidase Cu insertion factor (SCO1/SenC/PrrC family)